MSPNEDALIADARKLAADVILEDMKAAGIGGAGGFPEHLIKAASDTLDVVIPALLAAGFLKRPQEHP